MHEHIASELKAAASCLDAARAHVAALPLGASPAAAVVMQQAPTVAAALLVLAEVLDADADEMVGELWDTSPARRARPC